MNWWEDLSTLLLCIGVPNLGLYSLFLTIFNSIWIRQELELNPENGRPPNHSSIVGVLQILQQVPIDVVGNGVQDVAAWNKISIELTRHCRSFTATFWAQFGFIVVAFAFSMNDAFGTFGGI